MVIALLDISGNIVVKYTYDAWGNHKVLNASGVENTSVYFIGNINPIRYRGYYYDVETGLYYLQSRYYDPQTGRFINIDDISYLDPENINGLNLYAYCLNNPVMMTDSTGNAPKWWEWLISGVTLVAGIVLCCVPGGQVFGVGLIVAGASMLTSNILSAAGVDGKIASIIMSGLSIVAGVALCFTPFAGIGAGLIGQGVGSLAGGFISEALGGSFELGAAIGGIVGSVVGGFTYKSLLNTGKIPIKTKITSLQPDPQNPMTDEGINYWTKTLAQNKWKGYNKLPNFYGDIEPISVQKSTMMITNGHHRVAVLLKYAKIKYISVYLVP